jgi:hypothetical protein
VGSAHAAPLAVAYAICLLLPALSVVTGIVSTVERPGVGRVRLSPARAYAAIGAGVLGFAVGVVTVLSDVLGVSGLFWSSIYGIIAAWPWMWNVQVTAYAVERFLRVPAPDSFAAHLRPLKWAFRAGYLLFAAYFVKEAIRYYR